MKTLALVDAPDHVCCRYRIRAFEPALVAEGGRLTVEAIAANPIARLLQFRRAADHDVTILQRKLLPSWQLWELRRSARRLIFDFDDAILYRDSYDLRGPRSRRREGRFARTVRLADSVLAGNGFLARCAIERGAAPDRVRVIPTCVNTERYRPRSGIREGPGADLAWIGSSSTLQGLENRRPLLGRLGREVPGVRLRLIGDRFPDFGPLPVVAVPWDPATESAALADSDVGISLVPDDLWSRGKCGLKVLQYQAAGLPVVADPVGVHEEMVEPGVSGFLPRTDDAWIEAVRRLATDPGLRAAMGAAARASVESRYSVAAWGPAFLASLTGRGVVHPPRSSIGVAGGRATTGAAPRPESLTTTA